MRKLFYKHATLYTLSSLLTKGISVLLVPLYTRFLSPRDYGLLDLVLATCTLVNLTIALDFAITQSLLLPAGEAIRDSAALRTRLAGVLSGQFPRSAAFLWTVQHAQAEEATEHGQTPRTRPVAVDERPRHRPFRL